MLQDGQEKIIADFQINQSMEFQGKNIELNYFLYQKLLIKTRIHYSHLLQFFQIFPNYLTDHSKKCIKGKL